MLLGFFRLESQVAKKRITYYFRHEFEVTDPRRHSAVLLEVQRDDGCIVYLNGIEVLRSNMPEGYVSATTEASG